MAIAKFKRKGNCLDYVDNAIEIQKEYYYFDSMLKNNNITIIKKIV